MESNGNGEMVMITLSAPPLRINGTNQSIVPQHRRTAPKLRAIVACWPGTDILAQRVQKYALEIAVDEKSPSIPRSRANWSKPSLPTRNRKAVISLTKSHVPLRRGVEVHPTRNQLTRRRWAPDFTRLA
jgi:hypothetical protein